MGHANKSCNLFTVTLVCGCSIKVKIDPMGPRSTYPCRSNLGHGYRVLWAEWTSPDGTLTRQNPGFEDRVCIIEGCGEKHYSKGHCNRHYRQNRRGVQPERHTELGEFCNTCDEPGPCRVIRARRELIEHLKSIANEDH